MYLLAMYLEKNHNLLGFKHIFYKIETKEISDFAVICQFNRDFKYKECGSFTQIGRA